MSQNSWNIKSILDVSAEYLEKKGIETPRLCAEVLLAYLLDARVDGVLGGSGQTFPWDLAKGFCRSQKVFIAGGLTPANVGAAVRTLTPYGVDTASGVEARPGIKDPVLVEQFIRAARCAGIGNGGGCSEVAC